MSEEDDVTAVEELLSSLIILAMSVGLVAVLIVFRYSQSGALNGWKHGKTEGTVELPSFLESASDDPVEGFPL